MRKGDVSMPYVIGAALALVVLVVMTMIFTGSIGNITKKYDAAAAPTHTAAEKTGWCIATITQGKACGYNEDCSGIAQIFGGKAVAANTPEERAKCTGMHAYSESKGQFCCIDVG
ncbi:MAG TPA: hypothetical protein VJK52_03295 [Candidatus Nanoarchaeia archaeon]|nr:hypothetical protein [Candidatus Nanoarchaeia archaeon]